MKPIVILSALVLLSGCYAVPWSSSTYTPAEQLRLIKAQGGSGCAVVKATGTYPGFASGTVIIVEAYDVMDSGIAGADAKVRLNFKDCLEAVQPELQRYLQTP